MKTIIKMESLPTSKKIQLMKILERNKPKKTRTILSAIPLKKVPFGLKDYLKYLNDKLKR